MQSENTQSSLASDQPASDNRYFANTYVNSEVARCEREIVAYESEAGKPAWLVALGVEDWRMEQRMLLAGGCR